MMSRKSVSWLHLPLNAWQAGLEAQEVIGLRFALLAAGGEATVAETARMVSEKMSAALAAQHAAAFAVLTGNAPLIPSQTLAIYRQKMRANRRRLRVAAKSPKTRLTRRTIKRGRM
jgi:hypothetical protein